LAAKNVVESKESVSLYTAHGALADGKVAGNLERSTTRLPPAARPVSKAKYKDNSVFNPVYGLLYLAPATL